MNEFKGVVVGFAVIAAFLLGRWDVKRDIPQSQEGTAGVMYYAPTTYLGPVYATPAPQYEVYEEYLPDMLEPFDSGEGYNDGPLLESWRTVEVDPNNPISKYWDYESSIPPAP